MIDKRHSYVTRSTTVANHVISSVLVLGKDLNIAQLESDPSIISARLLWYCIQVLYLMRNNGKLLVFERLDGDNRNWMVLVRNWMNLFGV